MKIDIDRVETVTPQTLIGDLVLFHPEAAELLFSIGLHCLGCPSSGVETVSDAADVHGLDTEKLVSQLNDIIKVYHRHFYLNTYIVWTLLFCGSDVFIIYRIANVFFHIIPPKIKIETFLSLLLIYS